MNRILLLFAIITSLMQDVHAQCPIPNGDFETVGDISDTLEFELGFEFDFPVNAPVGWIPLVRTLEIALSRFIEPFFGQDTLDIDVFEGVDSYSPGANGTDKALLLRGDSLSLISDVIRWFPCASRPDKLQGFYRYESENERDSLVVQVILTKSTSLDTSSAIGFAIFETAGGPAEYTPFEADFVYRSDEIPDTAIVAIIAQRYDPWPQDTSFFAIDELSFFGGSVSTRDVAQVEEFLAPNPFAETLSLISDPGFKGTLEIHGMMGQLLFRSGDFSGTDEILLSHVEPGIYMATLRTDTQIFVQKIIKL